MRRGPATRNQRHSPALVGGTGRRRIPPRPQLPDRLRRPRAAIRRRAVRRLPDRRGRAETRRSGQTRAQGHRPATGRHARRRRIHAERDEERRVDLRRIAPGGALRRADPAPAHRRRPGACRGDPRRALFRLPRGDVRRGALFLSRGGGQTVHRHHGAAQAQHLPLAPDRRPGVAHRDQTLSRTDAHRVAAPGDADRPLQDLGRIRREAPRRLLHAGRNPRGGGLCRRTLH